MAASTAVATRRQENARLSQATSEIGGMLAGWVDRINADAYRGFSAERFLDQARHAAMKEPKLLICTEASWIDAAMKVSRWGLNVGEEVFLVPTWNDKLHNEDGSRGANEVSPRIEYRGYLIMARRQGLLRAIRIVVVYQGDFLEVTEGTVSQLIHRPASLHTAGAQVRGKRPPILGAYMLYQKPHDSQWHHFYLTRSEIEDRRAMSPMWNTDKVGDDLPEWYAGKSLIRAFMAREAKNGPMVEELGLVDGEVPTGGVVNTERGLAHLAKVQATGAEAGERMIAHRLEQILASDGMSDDGRARLRAKYDGMVADGADLGVRNQFLFECETVMAQRRAARDEAGRAAATPQDGVAAGEKCPTCSGPMEKVTKKRTPKSPDFYCQKRDCKDEKGYRSAAWLPKQGGRRG